MRSTISRCHVINFLSSTPTGRQSFVHGLPILNAVSRVRRTLRGRSVRRVIITVPSLPRRHHQRVLTQYDYASYQIHLLPRTATVLRGTTGLLDGIQSIRPRSLLNHSTIRFRGHRICRFLTSGIILIANNNKSVNSRLYHRVTARDPQLLIILSVCRGGTCSLRRRLQCLRKSGLGLRIRVTSIQSRTGVGRLFSHCHPRVIFRTTTRGRIPLVRSYPSRTVGGGIFNACRMTYTTTSRKTSGFVLISASGTIGPAGIVNTSGHLYRVIVRKIRNHSTAAFITMHFNGILNSGNSIVPLFGQRVTRNKPIAVASHQVVHCFVAVPRTTRLIVRTNTVTRDDRIFILSVNRPIGVLGLTRGLLHRSNLGPCRSVSVIRANLHPNRGLCRRLLVGDRRLDTAGGHGVFVRRRAPASDTALSTLLTGLQRTLTAQSGTRLITILRRIIPAFGAPRRIGDHTVRNGLLRSRSTINVWKIPCRRFDRECPPYKCLLWE